ncbi:MAG: GxxExxY protein [Calditrichaeota bacterium]|nr:GxxExxY protein [Calditrichota bacterium]
MGRCERKSNRICRVNGIEDAIIVELKSVRQPAKAHEVQLVNYLAATGKDVGLLFNFGETRVKVRRKVRELPRSTYDVHPVNLVKKRMH